MTQTMIEQLTQEEYCHQLSYGDAKRPDFERITYEWDQFEYDPEPLEKDSLSQWISTLESTTYPGMTFGYTATLY